MPFGRRRFAGVKKASLARRYLSAFAERTTGPDAATFLLRIGDGPTAGAFRITGTTRPAAVVVPGVRVTALSADILSRFLIAIGAPAALACDLAAGRGTPHAPDLLASTDRRVVFAADPGTQKLEATPPPAIEKTRRRRKTPELPARSPRPGMSIASATKNWIAVWADTAEELADSIVGDGNATDEKIEKMLTTSTSMLAGYSGDYITPHVWGVEANRLLTFQASLPAISTTESRGNPGIRLAVRLLRESLSESYCGFCASRFPSRSASPCASRSE